ncbi:MAG: PAS domain S-box protein, partial [Candidatus Heimdallarchaeota archaeon]
DFYLQKGGETKSQFHELVNLIEKLYDKKQAERSRRHLLDQQITINELAVTLGETRDLNRIYKTIFQHIYSIMDADTFVVSFFDFEMISPSYNEQVLDIQMFPPRSLNHKESEIQKKVIETGDPIYLSNLQKGFQKEDEKTNRNARVKGDFPKSAIFVPMKIGGDTIGVIEVQSNRLDAYTKSDIELLAALANVAANAIQNARLFILQQQTNIKLLVEKERTQSYLDIVEAIIIFIDTSGTIQMINRNGCDVLGYEEHEIIGKKWFDDFLPKSVQDETKRMFSVILKEKQILTSNINYVQTKDNQTRTISWKNNLIFDVQNNISGVLFVGIDITEQIRYERYLEESELRYQRIAEVVSDGLVVVERGKVKYLNDRVCTIFGYPREELMVLNYFDLFAPEEKERVEEFFKNAKEMGQDLTEFNVWVFSKDRIKKHINMRYRHHFGKNGKLINTFIMITDITEKKLAEIVLKSSEKKYRTTFDSIIDPMHVVNENLHILITNHSLNVWLQSLNIDDKIIGKKVFEVFPFLPPEIADEYKQVFSTGEPLTTTGITNLDDREIITETRKIPIFENNRVVRVITIVRDITKEKAIEEKLVESERKHRLLFDNSSDAILLFDYDMNIIDCNQKAVDKIGFTKEKLQKKKITNILNKENKAIFNDCLEIIREQGICTFDIAFLRKNKSTYSVEVSASIIEIDNIQYFQAILRDISEREAAEQERAKYIDYLKFLSECAMDFNALTREENIYEHIGNKITSIVDDSISIICSYDKLTKSFTLQKIVGLKGIMDQVHKTLNQNESGYEVKLPDSLRKKLIRSNFEPIEDSIIEITREIVPEKRLVAFMKSLKIKNIYSLPFIQKGKLIGAVIIMMKNNKEIASSNLLEAFVSQATVALIRRTAEEELLESEERYRELVETMSDGLGVDDVEGKFTYVNPKFCEMLGYKSEEMLDKFVTDFLDEENIEIYVEQTNRKARKAEAPYEIYWLTKKGKRLPTLVSPRAIYDASDIFKGSFAVITDISERKISEIKLKDQQTELQKQRDELESFASTIAHDLRGKMQVISLYNTMADHEYSNKITDSIDEMSSFIEDLLLLAKKGEILGDLTPVNLNKIITPIVERINSLEPDLEINVNNLPKIKGDEIKLKQVFENLLMNIVKHAEATKVNIYSEEDKNYYQIIVEDDGKGIPERKKSEIIESWSTKKYSSFGMLIILKIVQAHKGDLIIESEEDKGTRIIIYLPKK